MNCTTPKRSNSQRKRAYTYYVVSYTNGDSTIYLRTVWGFTGSLNTAIRFTSKYHAKRVMTILHSSRISDVQRLKQMKPNIRKFRDICSEEASVQSLIDL